MTDTPVDTPDTSLAPVLELITSSETKEPDGVTLLEGGQLKFVLDARSFNLRQPRLSEFKALRKSLHRITKIEDEDDEYDAIETWMRQVFNGGEIDGKKYVGLADRTLDSNSDDWPAWMVGGNLQGKLLVHWREVPVK